MRAGAVQRLLARERQRAVILLLKKRQAKLEAAGIISTEGAERMLTEVRREIEEAVAYAEASPYPEPSDLLKDIYTQEAAR